MTDPFEMPDHRHARFLPNPRNELFTAARHNHVDGVGHPAQHVADSRPIGCRHQLNAGTGQPYGSQTVCQARMNRRARLGALRPAPQDHGVARFQAQSARICSDVGAALVNDADDAQRHADSLNPHAVRPRPLGQNLADRVVEALDILESAGHRLEALIIQTQPIEERSGQTPRPRFTHIALICRQNMQPPLSQRRGGGTQRTILLRRAGGRQHECGGPRFPAHALHQLTDRIARHTEPVTWALINTKSSRCTISSRPRNPSTFSMSADLRPMMRAASPSEYAQIPRATSDPSGPMMLTVSPRSNRPTARVTPAGSKLLPPISARTAPSSTTIAPAGRNVPAIHCLRVANGVEEGTNQVQRAPSSIRCNGC